MDAADAARWATRLATVSAVASVAVVAGQGSAFEDPAWYVAQGSLGLAIATLLLAAALPRGPLDRARVEKGVAAFAALRLLGLLLSAAGIGASLGRGGSIVLFQALFVCEALAVWWLARLVGDAPR